MSAYLPTNPTGRKPWFPTSGTPVGHLPLAVGDRAPSFFLLSLTPDPFFDNRLGLPKKCDGFQAARFVGRNGGTSKC